MNPAEFELFFAGKLTDRLPIRLFSSSDHLKMSELEFYVRRCSPTPFTGSKPFTVSKPGYGYHHRFVDYRLPVETTIADLRQRLAIDHEWPINKLRLVIAGREPPLETRLDEYRRSAWVVFHLIFW